jgi:hypothetical protein
VYADIQRAVELARLLDEDRAIPLEHRLATTLHHPSIVEAVTKPTEHLDVVCAYLRRVHFVNYYGGKRFRDEAHMLSMGMLTFRGVACVPDDVSKAQPYSLLKSVSEVIANAEEETGNDEQEREEVTQEMSEEHEEVEEKKMEVVVDSDDVVQDTSAAAVAAGKVTVTEEGDKPSDANPTIFTTSITTNKTNKLSPRTSDRLIEPIIEELRRVIDQKLHHPSSYQNQDEDDAKTLLAEQEQTYQSLVKTKCKFEIDGKCRCCYEYCRKLFKSSEFLLKHLSSKHADFGLEELLLDAKPFLRKRFEAEDIASRPLPPVEVEAGEHGGTELKSVAELVEKVSGHGAAATGGTTGGSFAGGRGSFRQDRDTDSYRGSRDPFARDRDRDRDGNRRWSGGSQGQQREGRSGQKRGRDDDNSRDNERCLDRNDQPRDFRAPSPPSHMLQQRKMLPTYVDVDAPKVATEYRMYACAVASLCPPRLSQSPRPCPSDLALALDLLQAWYSTEFGLYSNIRSTRSVCFNSLLSELWRGRDWKQIRR